jgi:hypothetical protein
LEIAALAATLDVRIIVYTDKNTVFVHNAPAKQVVRLLYLNEHYERVVGRIARAGGRHIVHQRFVRRRPR